MIKKFFIVCGALFSSCFYFQFLLFGYHADDELISDDFFKKCDPIRGLICGACSVITGLDVSLAFVVIEAVCVSL